MAKMYVGVSGKAREVSGFWVGVSGVARKVVRGWVGVGGKARLFYESDFWTAGGISTANCLAAYQFKGASSETQALKDLTGHGYTLTKGSETPGIGNYPGPNTPTWAKASGFTFVPAWYGKAGYLNNSTLNGKDIKSVVVRYSGLTQTNRGYLVTAGGSAKTAYLYAATSYYKGGYVNRTGPGFLKTNTSVAYTTTARTSGVVGANFGSNGALYVNGTAVTTTTETGIAGEPGGQTFGSKHADSSQVSNAHHAGKVLIAAAFFSVALTAAQHKAVADAMLKI